MLECLIQSHYRFFPRASRIIIHNLSATLYRLFRIKCAKSQNVVRHFQYEVTCQLVTSYQQLLRYKHFGVSRSCHDSAERVNEVNLSEEQALLFSDAHNLVYTAG